nr:GRIP and coiled-coil domain-containing protein 2-like isoform X2 [Cherax quadricarinatus]
MEEETAEQVVLKCVNALELLPEDTPTIRHLVDGLVFSHLLAVLKNEDRRNSDLLVLMPQLDVIIKEHFAGPKLICFEDVAAGSQVELTKLTLLLLYITMITDAKLRKKLVNSPLMDQATQVKLKYLIESIQKRGSGMSTKFLDILCSEKLEGKLLVQCQTPVGAVSCASPNVYTNSPRTSSSPLRELIQSPPFRIQKLLNAKTREVKKLQQEIHRMENEREEMDVTLQTSHKKINKLKDELSKSKNDLQDLRTSRDDLEMQITAGDNLIHQQNESLSKRLMLVSAERDRLQEEMSTLYRAKLENENIIESQACSVKEMKLQLEELRQYLLESKPENHTIEESFEAPSPMNFAEESSSPTKSHECGENMADAVVDKILFETQEQLKYLREQHSTLEEKLSETTYSRDQLLAQVESITTENENIISELEEVRETYTQLQDSHAQVCDENKNTLQILQEVKMKNEMLEAERQKLEDEAHMTQTTISNMKDEFNKVLEQSSQCSTKLKTLEEQVQSSQLELKVTHAALEEVSNAKTSLQEEFSSTISKINKDFENQVASQREEYKLKVQELNKNIMELLSTQEMLTNEKISLEHEIQSLKENYTCVTLQMDQDLTKMANEKADLNMQVEIKSETLCQLQKEMEDKIKTLNTEKHCLEEEIQMKTLDYFRLQNEVETQVKQLTFEKVALKEELLLRKEEYSLLKQEMEKTNNAMADLKTKFEKEIETRKEAFLALQQQKENELNNHAKRIASLNEIMTNKEKEFSDLNKEFNKIVEDLSEMRIILSSEHQIHEETKVIIRQQLKDCQADFVKKEKEMSNVIHQKESAYLSLQLKMQEAENNFTSERITLLNEIQTKEKELNEKYKLTINSLEQQNSVLNDALIVKEEAVTSSHEIVNKLQNEMEIKANDCSALQHELEITRAAYEQEKCTLLQEMQVNKSSYISSQNDLEEKLQMLRQEKITLTKIIEEKEEAFGSLQRQHCELVDEFSRERAAISQELLSKNEHVNKLLSEKEKNIKSLEEQNDLNTKTYESKMGKLDEILADKCKQIEKVEQEKMSIKKCKEESEVLFNEQFSNVKLAMEVLKREKEEQAEINQKIICELNSCLQEKKKIITTMEEMHEQSLNSYKTQTMEMDGKISELKSTLAVKEREFDTNISSLREQVLLEAEKRNTVSNENLKMMENEKDKIIKVLEEERATMNDVIKVQEDALSALHEKVERALQAHSKEKADLMRELEERQATYICLENKLQNQVTSFSEEKALLIKNIEENKNVVLNQEQQIKTLLTQVSEEREALCSEFKIKENSFESLRQEMESSVETLKNKNNREVQEKQELIIQLKEEKENHLKMHAQEKISLNVVIKEKEDTIASLKFKLEEVTNTFASEKESLLNELNAQQQSFISIRDKYERAQESSAADTMTHSLQILEKDRNINKLKVEIEDVQEKYELEKKLNVSLKDEVEFLKEDIKNKDSGYSKNLIERQQEMSQLEESIAERNHLYETLQQQHEEDTEKHNNLVLQMQGTIDEKNEIIESLKEKITKLEKTHTRILQEMNDKIIEDASYLNSLKEEICELKKIHNQKEQVMSGELSRLKTAFDIMSQEKKQQQKDAEETINKFNENLIEKSNVICTLEENIRNVSLQHETMLNQVEERHLSQQQNENLKISELSAQLAEKSEALTTMTEEMKLVCSQYEVKLGEVKNLMKEQEVKMKTTNTALESELQAAYEKLEKCNTHIQSLEAKLIDKEKQISTDKEEIMRVEREAEKSTRSLTEELKAIKEKFRAEKRAVADKMKMSYQTELEKLMIQIEEQEQDGKEKEKILQKYELAKKKLTELLTVNNELKTANEHYEKQVTKYKEHVSKLDASLQRERTKQSEMVSRITDLESKYQPLKEKLHESENTVKRLVQEKRSLEVHVNLADAKMREMNKQWQRESFGGLPKVSSETQISQIIVTRPSLSSAEDDWDVNDSKQELLTGRTSKGVRKTMTRAASADAVFRKPCMRSEGATHQTAAASCKNAASATSHRNAASAASHKNVPGAASHKNAPGAAPHKNAPGAASHKTASVSATSHQNVVAKKNTLQSSETSHISDKSLGKSVPREMRFNCEDEDEEFSTKYLLDMQIGRCNPLDEAQWKRLSELQRRNSLYPPHMRSAYPAEMQSIPLQSFEDDKLREGCAVEDRQLMNLTQATENLGLDSPAFNLRKRKSFSDSTQSESSIDYSGGKRTKRLSTSYSRPGPPTPGRKSLGRGDKENRRESIASDISLPSLSYRGRKLIDTNKVKESPQSAYSGGSPVSSRRQTRSTHSVNSPSSTSVHSFRSPGGVTVLSKKGLTPRGKKGMTPSSLRKILAKGKSPWRKLDNEQETPKGLGDSTGSIGSSKLRIFRRPFGSKNYNVLSASLRSQENPPDPNDSLTVSIGRSDAATINKKIRGKR